jgi:hypothetical protein
MTEQAFHPVAELFPLMEGRDFESLVEDIRENGLHHAIWRDSSGLIVDGRNRYRACLKANVAPKYRTWEGDQGRLPAFVASENLQRRHLTDEQRAFIAAKMATMKRGDLGKAQVVPGHKGFAPAKPPSGGFAKPLVSTAQAASVMDVTHRAVERASAIVKHAPELESQVTGGKVSLSAAASEAGSRSRGEDPRKPRQARQAKGMGAKSLGLYERGVADLRRWLITFNHVKRLAPVADFVRSFLREQERGR